jgi:hypothetical protein
MARSRRVLLAATLLAALPGCQAYEDCCPWTWHLSTSSTTGRLVLRSEGNSRWRGAPTPLSLRGAARTLPPQGDADPPASPAMSSATGSSGSAETAGEPQGTFEVCGEIDGRKVYRRLLPSEQVARDLEANALK